MLERATATACKIENGDFICIRQLSLSCRPKISASGWSSSQRMKFFVDATPAMLGKFSLYTCSLESQLGCREHNFIMFSCCPRDHLSSKTFSALLSITVKSVSALSHVEIIAYIFRGCSLSWVQEMQAICFLQCYMILVLEQSSPASQNLNYLPKKSLSIFARQLMCSSEMWTWLEEKTYPPRLDFWTERTNCSFQAKQHLYVVESSPLSTFFSRSET